MNEIGYNTLKEVLEARQGTAKQMFDGKAGYSLNLDDPDFTDEKYQVNNGNAAVIMTHTLQNHGEISLGLWAQPYNSLEEKKFEPLRDIVEELFDTYRFEATSEGLLLPSPNIDCYWAHEPVDRPALEKILDVMDKF